jgi:Ni,Fe-hydrogenase III small subunit
MSLLRKIVRRGQVAEPAPPAPPASEAAGETARPYAGSVQVRHVDAGSCNGCELEMTSAFGPVHDAGRYGLALVASPRHADVLTVTGPVTRNMADPLLKTYDAMPAPKRVVAIGDCAHNCGVFAGAHGVEGAVADIVPVDLDVPGCPPTPQDIIEALRGLTGR